MDPTQSKGAPSNGTGGKTANSGGRQKAYKDPALNKHKAMPACEKPFVKKGY